MGKKARRTTGAAAAGEAAGAGADAGKMELLEDEEEVADAASTLNVSATYAKKYNERKDREELSRAKRILADEDADHSSDSDTEPEDEGAELLTDKVEDKIFETLHKIRSKDPSIYDKSRVFFQDDDFNEPRDTAGGSSSSTAPGLTYKDFVRETLMREGADAMAREEEEMEAGAAASGRGGRRKTPKQEEEELRNSIVAAARSAGGDGGGGDDAEDLFTLKEKTPQELKAEAESQRRFDAQRRKEKKAQSGDDVMARYWEGTDLDDNEKFLRDYLMNKAWQETTSMQPKLAEDGAEDGADSDDESHLEEQDEFEKEYNFRFEMEDGQQIQGHKRFQESSIRERNDKRKRQRKERADRKEAEKIRRTEELKRLKNLKKKEILRRLQQIQEVTGNDEMPLGMEVLDADFDPESHDRDMEQVFNEEYDQGEEPLGEEDLVKAPRGCDELDVSTAASEALERRGKAAKAKKGGSRKAHAKAEEAEDWEDEGAEAEEEDGDDQRDVDPEEWWMCDECHTGIPGGKRRFDCVVCENYTLCIKCFRVRRHPHKFVRRRVPDSAMPPEDFKGAEPSRAEVDKVMDEYFQLDYEDIIGGDLPTRFKYNQVPRNDCGLTPEQILEKSDLELNRVVPLKKLRTYRTDDNRVRKEAVWKWKNQPKLAAKVQEASEAAEASQKAAKGRNGISAQRLAAYNLQADRKANSATGEKPGKRKGKKSKT